MFEHDVDAFLVCDLADFFRNFLLVMINHVIGAELSRLRTFLIIAGSSDHLAIEKFRNLNSRNAHAGVSSQHQDSLAGANSGATDQHVPRSEKNKRNAGRLIEVESVRD